MDVKESDVESCFVASESSVCGPDWAGQHAVVSNPTGVTWRATRVGPDGVYCFRGVHLVVAKQVDQCVSVGSQMCPV